jgi:hypothetical protein
LKIIGLQSASGGLRAGIEDIGEWYPAGEIGASEEVGHGVDHEGKRDLDS